MRLVLFVILWPTLKIWYFHNNVRTEVESLNKARDFAKFAGLGGIKIIFPNARKK